MANINKIQLPNGTQYDIEDAVARGQLMLVTVTPGEDEQTGDVSFSADKTYSEISTHVANGGIAFCKMGIMGGTYLFPMVSFSSGNNSSAVFAITSAESNGGSVSHIAGVRIEIFPNDEVTVDMASSSLDVDIPPGTFTVHVQYSNGSYTADATYNEIISAIESGLTVVCLLNVQSFHTHVCYLAEVLNNTVYFRDNHIGNAGSDVYAPNVNSRIVQISSNNVVVVTEFSEDIRTLLSVLDDVVITSPTDGQVLTYDSTIGKWINATADAGFNVQIVQTLPTTNIDTHTIYFVPAPSAVVGTAQVGSSAVGSEDDAYDEYMYINNQWEKIGDTRIDLSGYATIDRIAEPEDDILVMNLLTEFGYPAPIVDVDENIVSDDDENLVLV